MSGALGRILVTGSNGNLGRRLLRRLASADPRPAGLIALVRSERAAASVRALGLTPAPELHVVDYAEIDQVAGAAAGCSAVVHLVGILKETPNARYAHAHEGTCRVLAEVAKRQGLRRAVYLSVLGAGPNVENACLASKWRAERILLESELRTTVLRVPMVLGGDDPATLALRTRARARSVRLLDGGASLEQPIDADDVVAAIVAALERPELEDRILELAGPESLPHRELVLRAAALLGNQPRIRSLPAGLARLGASWAERLLSDPPVTPPMLEVLLHDDRIDPASACQELGITLTPLDETLRRCIASEVA